MKNERDIQDEVKTKDIINLQDIIYSINLSTSPTEFFNQVKIKLKNLKIDDTEFDTISSILNKANILTMDDEKLKENSLKNIVNSLDYYSHKEERYVKLVLLS